jgi:peptidase C10-like protein/Spi protease inhibitor/carboxypeptidase family protein
MKLHSTQNPIKSMLYLFISIILLVCIDTTRAEPTDTVQAERAVTGWLRSNPAPMGTALGRQVKRTEVFRDTQGLSLYYVVYLEPSGFVIVPADDRIDPIIAVASQGSYDPSPDNPLGALVVSDMHARIKQVRNQSVSRNLSDPPNKINSNRAISLQVSAQARQKWIILQDVADNITTMGLDTISDVRVDPLVQSEWSQGGVLVWEGDDLVYLPVCDYYTPGPNYATGCVATAMAQLMRFHQHPTAEVGTPSFMIWVDGVEQPAALRGGDGSGGPYLWNDMVLDPNSKITEPQRQAIGALCYDAGVSIETYYTSSYSSAGFHVVAPSLCDTFGYSNAIHGQEIWREMNDDLLAMINPNLDAGLPVLLAIASTTTYSGHAVICDGYGYEMNTMYHHLNMGWRGMSDAWYNLPDIGTSYNFDYLRGCIYNIYTSGSGEIISGRVTGESGNPVSNVDVIAYVSGGSTYYTTPNARGIYVFPQIPSNTTYFVTAGKAGWQFNSHNVKTGVSNNEADISGNLWGIDFEGIASDGYIEMDRITYIAPEQMRIRVVDNDLVGKGTQNVTLMICGGDQETVTLTEDPANSGIYTGTMDTVAGAVNPEDGVIQVTGSQAVTALYEDTSDLVTHRATANVAGEAIVIFETDFTGGLPSGWSIVDGYTDDKTWSTDNPGSRTSPYWSGEFMIVESQNPATFDMDEELITQTFDCSAYERVTLSFSHDFKYESSEICHVDVRINGGSWQTMAHYQCADTFGEEKIDITAVAAHKDNVQIRWHYYDASYDWYWGIDNIKLTGVLPADQLKGDFEPDCDVDLQDFGILTTAWLTNPGDANWDPACDISEPSDESVDILDLSIFINHWLSGIGP